MEAGVRNTKEKTRTGFLDCASYIFFLVFISFVSDVI